MYFLFKKKKYDIILLQETHSTTGDENWWAQNWTGKSFFSHGKNDAQGVVVLVHKRIHTKISNVTTDSMGRFISIRMLLEDRDILLVNVYGPNNDEPIFLQRCYGKHIKRKR